MRKVLAAVASVTVVGAGLIAAGAPAHATSSASPVADTTSCAPVNPMQAATPKGSADGYTIFVRENATLGNSEIEGTLAVGGLATFGDPRGNQNLQYPIMHGGVGGNVDYNVPQLNGEANRVLLQQVALNNKQVQVKPANSSGGNAKAGAKIADRSVPAGYGLGRAFEGDGTAFFPVGGGNMSPMVSSATQPWTTLAAAEKSWGTAGDVLSYFPEDQGAQVLSSFSAWQQVDPPAGNDQTITLNGEGPSQLPLSAFEGVGKYKLDGYNENSFLVIKVAAADVQDGKVTLPSYSFAGKEDGVKEGVSHVLFDLSEISGDVEIGTLGEPVRGAVYAPNAHVIIPPESAGGRELEGQIIAKDFTDLANGKELHTNLFKGRFPCSDTKDKNGSFTLAKKLVGVAAGDFPEGTTFPVKATWDGGEKSFDLPADGTVVASGLTLPENTVVTLAEGDLPAAPAGYSFVSKKLSADSVKILAGGNDNIAWSVTNTYAAHQADQGGFDLVKNLKGVTAKDFPSDTVFTVTAKWTVNGVETAQEYTLPANGTAAAGPRDLPAGTKVTFSEVNVPNLDGYTFTGVKFTPETLTIARSAVATVTAENTYRGDVIVKTGGGAAVGLTALGSAFLLAAGAVFALRRKLSAK